MSKYSKSFYVEPVGNTKGILIKGAKCVEHAKAIAEDQNFDVQLRDFLWVIDDAEVAELEASFVAVYQAYDLEY